MGRTRIEVEIANGAAWITLDGPERRNALDGEAVAELIAACDRIDADPTIGVAIVTGAGSAFCSGADTAILERIRGATPGARNRELAALYAGFRRFGALAVPSVAAINGPAVGAGLNLALAADLRMMTTDATLVSGFSKLGIHPGGGHLHLLARAAGASVAAAMGLFAQPMSAEQAVASGIAWAAVEATELRSAVARMVAPLAADPDLARALAADLRRTVLDADAWDGAVEFEREKQAWSLGRTGKEA
jgi:enoyl-CoA hydratase